MTERNPSFEWRDAFGRAGYRGATLAVGTWIGNRWNGDSRHPLAPVEALMKDTGYSRRSVTLALATLRREGWLAQVTRGHRKGDGSAWASRYRLTVPVVEDLNVQPVASQCATGCTPLDQTLRPDKPTIALPEDSQSGVRARDAERLKHKWVDCPAADWRTGCSQCEPNDGCVVAMRRAGLLR